MNHSNKIAGIVTLWLAFMGEAYLIYVLFHTITSGVSTGRLGQVHPSGSTPYILTIVGIVIGMSLMTLLQYLGYKWLTNPPQEDL